MSGERNNNNNDNNKNDDNKNDNDDNKTQLRSKWVSAQTFTRAE